jgi:serine/threonine-protein phosphatase 2A activator
MTFQPPRKFILTKEQLEWFQTSETHNKIVSYIETLNQAVIGVKLIDPCEESAVRPHDPISVCII